MHFSPVCLLAAAAAPLLLPLRAAEVIPLAGAPVFNHARFYPVPAREKAMVGGRFAGSNVSQKEGFKALAEIKEAPREGEWTDPRLSDSS